jgi:PPOX class probable F420-dependent enzyme
MPGPAADRPFMPGYGVQAAAAGSGLMPWTEVERRLTVSHDYWVATIHPDGRPHVMPVWGTWLDDRVWFSSSRASRKARNLAADPRCTLTTDDAQNPVVVEGEAERITEAGAISVFVDAVNAKYDADMTVDFLDPEVNATFTVRPATVIALTHGDFTGSPTRWRFGPS